MCSTGSITPENKGGGSDPLWKISITKLLFFFDGFPKRKASTDCLAIPASSTFGMKVAFFDKKCYFHPKY